MIHNLGEQIGELQQKAANVSADAREEYERHIASLKSQKRQAEKKLTALEESHSGTLGDIRSGIQHAWNDVKETVTDTVERFK